MSLELDNNLSPMNLNKDEASLDQDLPLLEKSRISLFIPVLQKVYNYEKSDLCSV